MTEPNTAHATHGGRGARDPGAAHGHLLEHEYDGIREYDNPTPGWWHLIFLGSVVFSVFYYAFWEFSPLASSPEQVWAAKQNAETQRLFAGIGEVTADDAGVLMLMRDEKLMNYGQGMFQGNCAQCHAKDGGGINGTNLTDDYYKNVRTPGDLVTVITDGAANGAMPAWRNNFTEKERVLLAAYVATLRGTTPANARQAEGERIDPWPK